VHADEHDEHDGVDWRAGEIDGLMSVYASAYFSGISRAAVKELLLDGSREVQQDFDPLYDSQTTMTHVLNFTV
jgi:hypothetical protein